MAEKGTKHKKVKLEIIEQLRQQDALLTPLQRQQLAVLATQHKAVVEQVRKGLQPVLDSIVSSHKAIQTANAPVTISYARPVEYQILDELRELRAKKKYGVSKEKPEILITCNRSDNRLIRILDGKELTYDLNEVAKRKRILDILHDRGKYIKTAELKKLLDCPSTGAVSKLVHTFNVHVQRKLHLKKVELIQGKNGSGYRINPEVHVVYE